jgi:hypothetical protein
MSEKTQDGTYSDYIYANGQKIARVVAPSTGLGSTFSLGAATTNYYLDDHLGTAQVELDSSGNGIAKGLGCADFIKLLL